MNIFIHTYQNKDKKVIIFNLEFSDLCVEYLYQLVNLVDLKMAALNYKVEKLEFGLEFYWKG